MAVLYWDADGLGASDEAEDDEERERDEEDEREEGVVDFRH